MRKENRKKVVPLSPGVTAEASHKKHCVPICEPRESRGILGRITGRQTLAAEDNRHDFILIV